MAPVAAEQLKKFRVTSKNPFSDFVIWAPSQRWALKYIREIVVSRHAGWLRGRLAARQATAVEWPPT